MSKNNSNIAYLYLFITFFCWGSMFVVSKHVLDTVPPTVLCLVRFGLAALPMLFMARKRLPVRIAREDIKYFILIGFLGYWLNIVLNMTGIKLSNASVSSLVNAINPVAITIAAAFILKEKITPAKILCLALALVGTFIVGAGAADFSEVLGILLVLSSVVCWSIASSFIRKMGQKYDALIVTLYGISISVIFHIPSAAVSIIRAGGISIGWETWLWLLVLAFGCTTIPQYFWSKSLSLLEAGTCSLFYPMQAFWGSLLGALFLHEQLGLNFYIGSLFIVAVIVINWLDNSRRQKLLAAAAEL